ncbi:MAG: hypothetical protein ABI343_16995 [Burkholderiaceae bacterium]
MTGGLRLWVVVAICLGAAAALAADKPWRWYELGPIALRAPSDMVSSQGGADSTAGTLANECLQIDYDFGANTDTLQVPLPGSRNYASVETTLGGLPARKVRYEGVGVNGQPQVCAALHVAQVHMSSRGPIGLTVMACGGAADTTQQAEKVFASVRWRTAAFR